MKINTTHVHLKENTLINSLPIYRIFGLIDSVTKCLCLKLRINPQFTIRRQRFRVVLTESICRQQVECSERYPNPEDRNFNRGTSYIPFVLRETTLTI